jgi:hypothetical protein
VKFDFCLEAAGDCELNETIVEAVKFPKKICTWDDSYRAKGRKDSLQNIKY